MKFKHPADAMRARIEGCLYCPSCASFTDSEATWCRRHAYAPNPNQPLRNQLCPDFRRSENERKAYDYHLDFIIIGYNYGPPE